MKSYKFLILIFLILLSCEDRIYIESTPEIIYENGIQIISDAGYDFDKIVISGEGKIYELFRCKEYDGDIELLDIHKSGNYELYMISEKDTVFERTVYVSETENELLNITALDVKQGDCFIIDPPDHEPSLIDGGYGSHGIYPWQDSGNSTLLDYLNVSGISKLRYMIETHHDTDHWGGLSDVIESGNIGFDQYFTNESPELPAIGDTLFFSPEVKGVILHYGDFEKKKETDENDRSITILLIYHDFEMIFTGDIETPAEEIILSRNILDPSDKYEILKVPHHGSSSSSSDDFLKTVDPLISIISCGEGNPWDHPVPEILDRLSGYSESIFRTDKCGSLELFSNGSVVQIVYAQTKKNKK